MVIFSGSTWPQKLLKIKLLSYIQVVWKQCANICEGDSAHKNKAKCHIIFEFSILTELHRLKVN